MQLPRPSLISIFGVRAAWISPKDLAQSRPIQVFSARVYGRCFSPNTAKSVEYKELGGCGWDREVMSEMGIELELGILLGLLLVGPGIFAVFEVETPAWRKILKWSIVIGLTLGLYGRIGHWAVVVPIGLAGIGSTVHWVWCRKNGIHPLRATPRRRYYRLRGWDWHE